MLVCIVAIPELLELPGDGIPAHLVDLVVGHQPGRLGMFLVNLRAVAFARQDGKHTVGLPEALDGRLPFAAREQLLRRGEQQVGPAETKLYPSAGIACYLLRLRKRLLINPG
jgi:hypothetical protein